MNRIESAAVMSGVLLKKIRDDRYPSSTQMDLLEEVIPPQLMWRYVEVLMDKIAHDNRPSNPMIRRVNRLIQRMP